MTESIILENHLTLRLFFSSMPDWVNLHLRTSRTSSNFLPLRINNTIAWYNTSAISDTVRDSSSFSSSVLHNSSASSLHKGKKTLKTKQKTLNIWSIYERNQYNTESLSIIACHQAISVLSTRVCLVEGKTVLPSVGRV